MTLARFWKRLYWTLLTLVLMGVGLTVVILVGTTLMSSLGSGLMWVLWFASVYWLIHGYLTEEEHYEDSKKR